MSITERRLTAVLVALLTICVIAAASTAFLLGRRATVAAAASDRSPTSLTTATPSVTGSPSTPGTTSEPSSPVSTVASSPPSSPQSASTSATPTRPTVALDPPVKMSAQAAKHPEAAGIQQLVSLNFRSINTLDYQLWADTVTPEQSAAFGPKAWLAAYRTSKDSGITIVSIEPDTRWITITFSSTQDADLAPADTPSTCLNWKIVRPVVTVNGKLRLAKSIEGLSVYRGCA